MKASYGWVIVAAGMLITCIGIGSMMSLGVFLQPISVAEGWTRAEISSAATVNFLCMGAGSFLWGSLSDRFGTRAVVLSGGLLLGFGLAAASQAATPAQFQIVFGVLVGLAAGSFYAPMVAITSNWFTVNRSIAIALVSSGMSIGSATVAPLVRALITGYDWRVAMLAIAGLAWALIVPAALLVRPPPVRNDAAGRQDAEGSGGAFTVASALRTPQFAALALTHFACCAAHSGPIFHMVSYAIDCGVTSMAAATVMGVAGLSALGGRIICGLIADRVGAKPTLIVGLLVQAFAVSLYLFPGGLGAFYGLAVLFGIAYGGVMPLYAILVREYFGARIMGSIFGAVAMASTIGMAIGPAAGGWAYDTLGGYFWLYVGSSAIGLGAVAIAFTFRPPRPLDHGLAQAA